MDCSVCGYAVEWLRSCFRSRWRLWRGSEQTIAGRYYFADEGTPHYPCRHNLWSRDWVSADGFEHAALGEWAGEREYDRGDPPPVLPVAKLVGNKDCIENGEAGQPVENEDCCGAMGRYLPLPCYEGLSDFELHTNIWACDVGYHLGRILEVVYTNLPGAVMMAEQYFGTDITTQSFPRVNEAIPPILFVRKGSNFFVFHAGTEKVSELVTQAILGIFPPINRGFYASTDFYEFAAQSLLSRLSAVGAADATRITLCGHSYGGAVCFVAAAKLHLARVNLRIEILTWGMPKSGDSRLVDLTEKMKQLHYTSFDDPVPFVPPDAPLLADVLPVINDAFRALVTLYARPRKRFFLTREGEIRALTSPPLDQDLAITLIKLIQGNIDNPIFNGHSMTTYNARILAACSDVDDDCNEFPMCDENCSFRVIWHDLAYELVGDFGVPNSFSGDVDLLLTPNVTFESNWESDLTSQPDGTLYAPVDDFGNQFRDDNTLRLVVSRVGGLGPELTTHLPLGWQNGGLFPFVISSVTFVFASYSIGSIEIIPIHPDA